MIPYRIKNQFTPPTPGKLRLGGMIADQMETFFSERVTSDYARDTILAECEEQFRLRNDDELPVGYWRGEFWGKWVISGCRVARYESDERLRETLHKTALALISTADPDGYIGTYRDKQNFFSPPLKRPNRSSAGRATGTGISGAGNTPFGECSRSMS